MATAGKGYCLNGSTPHPIPYQGSKRQLAPLILPRFPKRFERLVEPFAGSAAISIAVAQRDLAKSFWINDGHKPLVDLWSEILDRPHDLAEKYAELWHDQEGRERAYFDIVRSQFNESHQPHHFLYLLARCVKAVIRYNTEGRFNNTPDNRRKGAKPGEMKQRLVGASKLLFGRTEATSWDYKKVLAQCTPKDVIYMDPPYQGVSGDRDSRYLPTVVHDEFCDELAALNKRGCRYIVSYDGRTGDKVFGELLPKSLGLCHLEICAGRSSQATLLGRSLITYESLYISPTLANDGQSPPGDRPKRQLTLV